MELFPEGFLWGAGTSSHQVEGQNVGNHFWDWEHAPSSPFVEPSGDACDSFHRWPEDVAFVAGAGLTAYRFSLEWSRIEPAPGEFSTAALDHYRRMVAACREHGLAPVVTLSHFSLPRWVSQQGGWLSPRMGDTFARFTEAAVPVLAGADFVCTLNEPNLEAALPGLAASAASGNYSVPVPDLRLTESLLECHRRAMEILRGAGAPPSGMTLVGQEYLAEPGGEELMMANRALMEDQFLAAAAGDDFLGLQVYSCVRFGPNGPIAPLPETMTQSGMEFRPMALRAAVGRVAEVLPTLPILITENGVATDDDTKRIEYIDGALGSLVGAIKSGADVRGYVHWSLLDNFEWFRGYAPKFGLISVDRETFTRSPKPSLLHLGQIARRNFVARD